MNDIFSEFKKVSYADWLEKIETDLKGKPLSVLESTPEPGLSIKAYHHAETGPQNESNTHLRNAAKASNDWFIRQVFSGKNANNVSILAGLNDGINAVGFVLDKTSNFKNLSKHIGFEYINSDIQFMDTDAALYTEVPATADLNFDVIALNAAQGQVAHSLEEFLAFYNHHNANKTIWISGSIYGKAGASTVQELALTLAHLNDYVQYLTEEGKSLAEINEKICIELSVNENYFVNIAKFRVIRSLVALMFQAYDENYTSFVPKIYAKTNLRHLAKNDKNNNALRETTQAMSAVIGGCDVLTVDYGQYGSDQEVERFERIAKNIQLILKEEAYLDKVVDPGGGSYYIENLTNQLLQECWTLFLEIENKGGLTAALVSGYVNEIIGDTTAQLVADMQDNTRTFLGVNKHPNGMEDWVETKAEQPSETTAFPSLKPFILEDHFSKTVASNE